jgi:hypothetical protein
MIRLGRADAANVGRNLANLFFIKTDHLNLAGAGIYLKGDAIRRGNSTGCEYPTYSIRFLPLISAR